ncbi:hypothetical protein PTTG_29561 [Puccinia triticina 1-1 BBBD Race 1]|uniref:Uncharacterized protein n=1 Tax=Puccinia triticina (isolate 1-1 / race 1 (BBBD)) TaxID=630390 RepID=A0A180G5I8_PUCT1|nr:hypothetical protein PTTG_29561 [Puccinia triticina 1-1 BBBD Race 1]
MTPTPNPASTSKSVGASNWHINDISHRTRLAEDIALLQSNFEKLPPSPETTTGPEKQKGKAPMYKKKETAPVEVRPPPRGLPPHLDPRLPLNAMVAPHSQTDNFPPRTVNHMGLDERLAKEIRDFEEAEFHLKQSKLLGNAIQTANSQFRPENVLKADGSNFGNWYRNLAEVACPNLKGPRFFFEECHNSTYEKIGRAVLIAGID